MAVSTGRRVREKPRAPAGEVKVGDGVSLAASAGLFRNIEDGETWGGTPAKPLRQWMREVAWLQKQANPKKSG